MPVPSVVVIGARETAFDLRRIGIEAPRTLGRTARFYAVKLKFEVQRRSPVDTGLYRDSWELIQVGRNEFAVSNPQPYMNRLEYGFLGTDALGREYDQAPQPHIRPAADAITHEFYEASELAIAAVIR